MLLELGAWTLSYQPLSRGTYSITPLEEHRNTVLEILFRIPEKMVQFLHYPRTLEDFASVPGDFYQSGDGGNRQIRRQKVSFYYSPCVLGFVSKPNL